MTDEQERFEDPAELRSRAEARARQDAARDSADLLTLSADECRQALHELRVHQIELEMQNEELRRAQLELDASRARYFDLYDLAPVGYCTISDKGLVLEANLTIADLLNIGRAAVVGQPLTRFLHREDQDTYYRHLRRLLETGAPQALELRMVRDGSPPFWAQLTTRAAYQPDGASVYRVVVGDISERKQAEEHAGELQERLNQAHRLESIGRLAGGVAHEFNNMLTVIMGNLELAMGDMTPGGPFDHPLQDALRAAKRSADITRQLLSFSRKQIISPRVIDLNRAIEQTLGMLQGLIGENNVLAWLPEDPLWPVKIDPAQVDQIVANLCINARDAIVGVGKIIIETHNVVLGDEYCAVHPECLPGDFVVMSVSDDGCGMDQRTLGNLFEPFFTTKEVGEGTGLGLAVLDGIVKQNGGFVGVESKLGEGSTLKVYLPRYGVASEPVPAELGTGEPAAPLLKGRKTILLVDDEPAILRTTKRMLERLGYTVLTASTPGDAVRVAHTLSGELHLVMTNLVLPEMNGSDLADRLRSIVPGINTLLMSGYSGRAVRHSGLVGSHADFIQKPFSREDLSAKLRDLLGG